MKAPAALPSLLFCLLVSSCGGGGGSSSGSTLAGPPTCGPAFQTPNYAADRDPSTGALNTLVWWDRFPIRAAILNDEVLDGGGGSVLASDLARTSAQRWATETGGSVSITFVPSTEPYDISISFQRIGSRPGSGGTLGVTRASYIPSTREMVSAEVTINLWPGMTPDEVNRGLPATITHELGHCLFVFGHSPDGLDLMHPSLPFGQDRGPTTRDRNTLFTAYCGSFSRQSNRTREPAKTITISCGHKDHAPGFHEVTGEE
jgi:predicted Zn-dependent protease